MTNARKIVDTRNRIIHGYDSVSEDIIWSIVSNDLKKLRKEIANLLDE
ncbi:HepT-like ribonuclease domain-containing protein [Alkalitalea saponilacus]|nr:HepT-like ribonuclease domain-containing protein [Alkalitalea saponilacus]